jgi:hypothetical protein
MSGKLKPVGYGPEAWGEMDMELSVLEEEKINPRNTRIAFPIDCIKVRYLLDCAYVTRAITERV